MKKLKIGILFGGPSREREISFAGGRTVYDNLNKSIFEPIPIFIDSLQNLIILDWEYVYKGTIRDFYPPVNVLPESPNHYQVYVESLIKEGEDSIAMQTSIGRPIGFKELKKEIDIAFLALHGQYGEDGQIQGILESHSIPYTGSGVFACATGMNKSIQKSLMEAGGYDMPKIKELNKTEYKTIDWKSYFENIQQEIGFPLVIRPANQGSSIGVTILDEADFDNFKKAIDLAFFKSTISLDQWQSIDQQGKIEYVRDLSDIRSGLGFPLFLDGDKLYHPEELLSSLNKHFDTSKKSVHLEAFQSESTVIIESFIEGREFSCVVIKGVHGESIALPPTEIKKLSKLYDYRSKYLPGLSRKVTPIELPENDIKRIQTECERLFEYLRFDVYARIDGFYTPQGHIILNDPNTTSGMLPSSFFFHQAAEIGMNPSEFISYIIYASLKDRIATSLISNHYGKLLSHLETNLKSLKTQDNTKQKVGVILGGYSFERHISVESGRNIYEKLASSAKYDPLPIFLHGSGHNQGKYQLYQIPINLLLKDNADDIKDKIDHYSVHPVTMHTRDRCQDIMSLFVSSHTVLDPIHLPIDTLPQYIDSAFIALHGRPGEDGNLQSKLDQIGVCYNGSSVKSSSTTIHKYNTLQTLKQHGFNVADQLLVAKDDHKTAIRTIESKFEYPMIAKPVDDGCSSAVMMIKNRSQLENYLQAIFRDSDTLDMNIRKELRLSPNEEFPSKKQVLIESLIANNGAKYFLEITGGLLTHTNSDGSIRYEMFEPSEALASGEILSLEEKFLAGEGQNITPARFGQNQLEYKVISSAVKADLQKAAEILEVTGYARIDAFVRVSDKMDVETIIIEVNSLPGMTPATCIFHQAAINGYKPYDFIDKILEFAAHE